MDINMNTKPDLNYRDTDVLNEFTEKYRGWFIYLRNNYNGYKPGLYFGGIDGWERLTNDNEMIMEPTSNIPLPVKNDNTYIYNGKEHVFLPSNWDGIEKFVNVFNNTHSDAGRYEVLFMLKYEDWTWEDGTKEGKILEYVIEPEHVSSATVILSKESWAYGDELPYVKSVAYQDKTLIKGKDYEVVYPENGGNTITINFINNYEGSVKTKFSVIKKRISLPVFEMLTFPYIGEEIYVYPENWNVLEQFCKIENNKGIESGEYYLTISLKNTSNYCWDNENGDSNPITKKFIIGTVEVPVPEWDYEDMYITTFDWKQHSFYPLNWDKIKPYVNIVNNININAGEYTLTIKLIGDNVKWSDGTVTDKTKDYTINRYIINNPIWNTTNGVTYNGSYYTYLPLNWEDIKEYCEISNNVHVNAGTYEVAVSLKDKTNYGWKSITGAITNFDMLGEFTILKAPGFFLTLPYIHGNFYVDDYVTCVAMYVDTTCEVMYEWYRSKSVKMDGSEEYIKTTTTNEYKITHDDVNYFIICNVIVKSTAVSNYMGNSAYTASRVRVSKTIVYDVLRFEDDKYEDSIYYLQSIYALPNVIRLTEDDGSYLEYSIVSGNDVADLPNNQEGYLLIKGVGDVVVEVKVLGSKNYIYSPNTLRFTLHVYSNDVIYWGMYDKEQSVTEENVLYKGLIPENAQEATLKENEKGIHALLFRKNFPFRKFNGDEQNYYGWYVLIPVEKRLIEIDENGGSAMPIKDVELKNPDGSDLILTNTDNRQYKVYGKFNVAKTSDNWMLHILFR